MSYAIFKNPLAYFPFTDFRLKVTKINLLKKLNFVSIKKLYLRL